MLPYLIFATFSFCRMTNHTTSHGEFGNEKLPARVDGHGVRHIRQTGDTGGFLHDVFPALDFDCSTVSTCCFGVFKLVLTQFARIVEHAASTVRPSGCGHDVHTVPVS